LPTEPSWRAGTRDARNGHKSKRVECAVPTARRNLVSPNCAAMRQDAPTKSFREECAFDMGQSEQPQKPAVMKDVPIICHCERGMQRS